MSRIEESTSLAVHDAGIVAPVGAGHHDDVHDDDVSDLPSSGPCVVHERGVVTETVSENGLGPMADSARTRSW